VKDRSAENFTQYVAQRQDSTNLGFKNAEPSRFYWVFYVNGDC